MVASWLNVEHDPMTDHLLIPGQSGDFYPKARKPSLRFQTRLLKNVADALASHGIPHRLERTWSRIYLETPDAGAAEVLSRVFGLQSVSIAEPRPWTELEDLVETALPFFAPSVRGKS